MPVDVVVPSIGESITTVEIAGWLKNAGDMVAIGDPLVEVDSDKATLEVPSPAAGLLVEVLVAEGDEVDIGAVIARIDSSATAPAPAPAAAAPAAESAPAANDAVRAGPAARQAASKKGVDLKNIAGSGKHGRVTRADVEGKAPAPAPAAAPAAKAPAKPQAAVGATERVKMSPLRRTIARRLVEVGQKTAMLTTFQECDMTAVMALRKRYQERFVKRYGFKLGFMSFFTKASIEALKEFPAVNAELDDDGKHIIYKNFYNIAVAVSGPKGLVVPVITNADQLSFAETELAITNVAKRARDNKLTPADFQDGTFTISNGGIFGSMMSTPILNAPQVGILGMHNIVKRAVVIDDEIVIRPMMYLALSYDHRIIDGKGAVGFLKRIKECVEHPERILLEV